MGLDMYAFAAANEADMKNPETRTEVAYWRKHNRLHGWMESLYRTKGGTEEFNVIPLELTETDLNALEEAIKGTALPATQGFFFGSDSYSDYTGGSGDYERDCKFLVDARECIKEGKKVYYYCWW
jgi:hypothetical protein